MVPNTAMRSVLYFCGYCGAGDGPRRLRRRLDGRRDDAEHVVAAPRTSAAASSAAGAGRRRRSPYCSRAGRACSRGRNRASTHGARQVDDLRRRAVAVRHVGVVAQIEEALSGKRSTSARSTVSPPRPESKTPIMRVFEPPSSSPSRWEVYTVRACRLPPTRRLPTASVRPASQQRYRCRAASARRGSAWRPWSSRSRRNAPRRSRRPTGRTADTAPSRQPR